MCRGDLLMVAIDVASESITPVCALSGGHSGTVRSFVYLPEVCALSGDCLVQCDDQSMGVQATHHASSHRNEPSLPWERTPIYVCGPSRSCSDFHV